MKKLIATLVLSGALLLAIVPSASAHNMDFNTGLGIAQDVALNQCQGTVGCIAFGADPCRKITRHKMICTTHIIVGPVGDQAAQSDCHRELQMKLKRRSFGIKTAFLGPLLCNPNTQHPGFRGLAAS